MHDDMTQQPAARGLSRRSLAKGSAWTVPGIAIASAAPAVAASSCAGVVSGRGLPADAFVATYIEDRNETLGRAANKQVAVDFGFRVSPAVAACLGTSAPVSLSSSNAGGTSYVRLSNGQTYAMTNRGSVPASGTVGAVDGSCQGGLNGTEACGTSGISAYGVSESRGTSSFVVTVMSIYRQVTVAGYGTTELYLNGEGLNGEGTFAKTLTVSATPLVRV